MNSNSRMTELHNIIDRLQTEAAGNELRIEYWYDMAQSHQRRINKLNRLVQSYRDVRDALDKSLQDTRAELAIEQNETRIMREQHDAEIEMLTDIVSVFWLAYFGVVNVPYDIIESAGEWLEERAAITQADGADEWEQESKDTRANYNDLPF